MREKEVPVDAGTMQKTVIPNISELQPAVNPPKQDNLIFFHTAFSSLPAEEYKAAMSAIALYAKDGTIPALSGAMQVIFALAKDRIDGTPTPQRKRGGQQGNKNAKKRIESNTEIEAKNESVSNKKRMETIQNESETIKPGRVHDNQPHIGTPCSPSSPVQVELDKPVPAPAYVEADAPSTPVPVEQPATLNLNNKLNLNNLINLNLISGNETKEQTKKRIGSRLRGAGFFVTNKMLDKILATIPDPAWLLAGYDFPTWLAQFIAKRYHEKPEAEKLKLFYSAALPKEGKWEEIWESYPNWLNTMIGNEITKKEAIKRKTYPQDWCPDCGQETKLKGEKCPKCGSFYQWSQELGRMEFVRALRLDTDGGMQKLLDMYVKKQREATNAQAV